MKLSVVIPFYERLPELLTCLNSLNAFRSLAETEIIVTDDASPSVDVRQVIHPAQAGIVSRNAVNVGFGANCNAGAALATGDVILFCNQDIIAVPGLSDRWDAKLLDMFLRPEVADIGIVGPKLLFFESGAIQSCGGLFDAKGQPFHRCLGYARTDFWEVNQTREVSWTTGAALAIRRSLFEQLDGFDPEYKAYFEDVALCLRAREAGYQCWYTPEVTFIHRVGTTGGSKHFLESAATFKSHWVDTGKVKPDVNYVLERFWP